MATKQEVHQAVGLYKKTLDKAQTYINKKSALAEAKEIFRKMAKIEARPRYRKLYQAQQGDDADYPGPWELDEYRALERRYKEITYENSPKVIPPRFQLKDGKMQVISEKEFRLLIKKINSRAKFSKSPL